MWIVSVSYALQRPVHSFSSFGDAGAGATAAAAAAAEIMVFRMNDFLFIAIYFRKHEYLSYVRTSARAHKQNEIACSVLYVHLWEDSGEMGEGKKIDRCLKYSAHITRANRQALALLRGRARVHTRTHICTYTIFGKSPNE